MIKKIFTLTVIMLLFSCGSKLNAQSPTNVALGQTTNTSSVLSSDFPGSNAVDGDSLDGASRWRSADGMPQWIEIDLGDAYKISQLKFWTGWGTTNYTAPLAYELQYWTGSDWGVAYDGSANNSAQVNETFTEVTTTKVRLYCLEGNGTTQAKIYEIKIYGVTANVAVTGVEVTPATMSIVKSTSEKAMAEVIPAYASNTNVTWSSDDKTVATVDATGNVSGVNSGTANIIAVTTDGGHKDTCVVKVTNDVVVATGVTLDKASLNIIDNDTVQLIATVSPDSTTDKSVSWSSDNTDAATVDANGQVVATGVGTATITVTTNSGSNTATCNVTVDPINATGVTLNKEITQIVVNDTEVLEATVTPTDATNQAVSWSSDMESVATVDANGEVVAVATGTANIIATTDDGGHKDTCVVTVIELGSTQEASFYEGLRNMGCNIDESNIDVTLYLKTDGDNNNDGLTPSTALKTWKQARIEAMKILRYGQSVKVYAYNGVYNDGQEWGSISLPDATEQATAMSTLLVIEGESRDGVIISDFSNIFFNFKEQGCGNEKDNVVFRNLTFKNGSATAIYLGHFHNNGHANNALVENVWFENIGNNALIVRHYDKATMRNLTFVDCQQAANTIITNSLMENVTATGTGKDKTGGTHHMAAYNTTFRNIDYHDNPFHAFRMDQVFEYCLIENCNFSNNGLTGMVFETAKGPATIRNCTIVGNDKNGIALSTAHDFTILDSDISNNYIAQIRIEPKARPVDQDGCQPGSCALGIGDLNATPCTDWSNLYDLYYTKNTIVKRCNLTSNRGPASYIYEVSDYGTRSAYADWWRDWMDADSNNYYNPDNESVFGVTSSNTRTYANFGGWKSKSGEDANSTWNGALPVDVSATGLDIAQSSLNLYIGQGTSLNYSVLPSNASNNIVNWSSSSPGVATVNVLGYVEAIGAGSATITGTTDDGGHQATCSISVDSVPDSYTNVALNKPVTVDSYNSSYPGSNAVDGDRSSNSSRWMSDDVAFPHWIEVDLQDSYSISQFKFWTGNSGQYTNPIQFKFEYWDGSSWTTLVDQPVNMRAVVNEAFDLVTTSRVRLFGYSTATANNLLKLYEVKVFGVLNNSIEPVTGIDLDSTTLNLYVGEEHILKATIKPGNATNQNVTWSSENNAIADVDASGKVTGVATGSTVIVAITQEGGHADTCLVTVQTPTSTLSKKDMDGVKVYPNPFENKITLDLNDDLKLIEVRLYDIHGKLVFVDDKRSITLNDGITSGMYILQLITETKTEIFRVQKK